jgi:predicted metalloprotease with PDZ domain
MHFVSSLKVPARLKVMPIGNGHHKAWHASSPRCVAFRVEPELAAKSWGLSMTASTIERGDAHVAAVDPLVPQVAAGVHSGDKVLAINMLDTSGVSYSTCSRLSYPSHRLT